MPADLSTEDWIERIEPHLSTSLRTVSDEITRTEAVQQWLHDASLEVAEDLGAASNLQGEMEGYARMMDRLEETLPNLLEAVDELTDGHAHLELHWRPTNPNFSRLYLEVDHDYTAEVVVRLAEPTPDGAQAVLNTVVEALPEGTPFPNRPNTATGLVVFEGRGVGLRVSDRLSDDGDRTYRTVTLLPPNQQPQERLSPETAIEHLLELLHPAESGP